MKDEPQHLALLTTVFVLFALVLIAWRASARPQGFLANGAQPGTVGEHEW